MELLIVAVFSFVLLYFLLYWLYVLVENFGNLDNKEDSSEGVSIIIPAYNEEESIKEAIDSCLSLDYPKNKVEVIVVNDGSTDKTDKICLEYAKKDLIKYYSKERGGKGSALNLGFKKARFDIVATLDADSHYSKHALSRMVNEFKNPDIAAVTPAMKVFEPSNFLEKMQYIEYISALFFAKLFSFFNCIYVTPGPGSIYRKSAIESVGYFNEDCITEDMEIAFKLQKHGYKIVNSLSSEVYTRAPCDFASLFKQRLRWNSGFLENSLIHFDIFKQKRELTRFVMPYNFFFLVASFVFLYVSLLKPLYKYYIKFLRYYNINFDIVWKMPNFSRILTNFLLEIKPSTIFIFINTVVYAVFIFLAFHFTKEKVINRYKTPFYTLLFVLVYPFFLAMFSIGAIFYFIKYFFSRNKFELWRG